MTRILPVPARSSYGWLLRLGRTRVMLLVTGLTILGSCLLTALVVALTTDPAQPISIRDLWAWSMATAVVAPLVLCPLVVLVMMDMLSHLEQALQSAHRLAQTDAQTGLRNRRDFIEAATAALEDGRAHGASLALLMIDIDDFKRINDTFGHLAGDDALVVVSSICGQVDSPEHLRARFGGEEFAVLLRHCERERAVAIAETVRQRVEGQKAATPDGESFPLSVSIGCACSGEAGYALKALLSLADERLYVAKRAGKNRVEAG